MPDVQKNHKILKLEEAFTLFKIQFFPPPPETAPNVPRLLRAPAPARSSRGLRARALRDGAFAPGLTLHFSSPAACGFLLRASAGVSGGQAVKRARVGA